MTVIHNITSPRSLMTIKKIDRMMTRLRGGNGFRPGTIPTYNSPSPPIYPTERKLKKPLMEKHRRERMNHSMNVLKERIIHAHPHESSKLEKADILEKTVLYVSELESQMEMARREKLLTFQQGYLQACHELVELIVQHQNTLQASNPTELKQKLRQTVEKHLKTKCSIDPMAQQSVNQHNTTINTGLHTAMQFAPNRMSAPTLQRPIHPMPSFIMPSSQLAALNYLNLNRLPHPTLQNNTSPSLLPFPPQNMNLPRLVPRQCTSNIEDSTTKSNNSEPMTIDEEIDVERVEEEDDRRLDKKNHTMNTTEDSGLSDSPPISSKSGSEVWRPF